MKIKIKELCIRLNNNPEEKWVFFKSLESPEFLNHFYEQGLLLFNDNSTNVVVQYLCKIFNDENKDLIIKVINKNLTEKTFDSGRMHIIVQLLEKLSLYELEKNVKNIDFLFSSSDSIYFCKFLLAKDEISNTDFLYKKCIETLTKYKLIQNNFVEKQKPVSVHAKFLFQDVYAQSNLQKILIKNEIYEYLKKTYENLISEIGDLSLCHRQYIKPEENEDYDLKSDDVRDIILNFMSVYFQQINRKEQIKDLLFSNSIMFNKLGLFAISLNYSSYKSIFWEFLHTVVNKEDFIDFLYQLKYELLTVFELIETQIEKQDKESSTIDAQIESMIKNLLQKIPNEQVNKKYLFLHGLKNHPSFKNDFLELKAEFDGKEIFNPKLFFSSTGGFKEVVDVSPITKEELDKKNIIEQIKFLNTYITPNRRLDAEGDCYKEENEEGLNALFKEVLNDNILLYLNSNEIKQLTKPKAIGTLFQSINISLNNETLGKEYFEKIMMLIKYFVDADLNQKKDWGFDYYLNELIKTLVYKDLDKTLDAEIKGILQTLIDKNQDKEKLNSDIAFDAINLTSGRYWETWFRFILEIKHMSNEDIIFFERYLQKDIYQYSNKLMLYHLGVYMDDLFYVIENYSFSEKLKEFISKDTQEIINESFLIGFLSYTTYIDVFKCFKDFIINEYQSAELPHDVHRRFMDLLTDAKFKLGEDVLFQEFEEKFLQKDKEEVLERLTSKDRLNSYNKEKVIAYIKSQIEYNSDFPHILIRIFDLYVDPSELLNYSDDLINMFKLYDNVLGQIITENYLESFLNNLLNVLKKETKPENLVKIYQILYAIIAATKVYDYLNKVSKVLKALLIEYSNKNYEKAKENTKLLANQICQTKGLIQYCDMFIDFI